MRAVTAGESGARRRVRRVRRRAIADKGSMGYRDSLEGLRDRGFACVICAVGPNVWVY